MMKQLFLTILLMGNLQAVQAQRDIVTYLQTDRPGQGKVRIYQDAAVARLLTGSTSLISPFSEYGNLLTSNTSQVPKKTVKARGYRIQVYAGNNSRRAKAEAQSIGKRINDEFPELSVYTYFQSPRWLCRIGDFKSIEEADGVMRRLREGGYKEVSIVKEIVNLPVE